MSRASITFSFFKKLFLTFPKLGWSARDALNCIAAEEKKYRETIHDLVRRKYMHTSSDKDVDISK